MLWLKLITITAGALSSGWERTAAFFLPKSSEKSSAGFTWLAVYLQGADKREGRKGRDRKREANIEN